VLGGSYWTATLQYRALTAGARLSRSIGRADSAPEYERQASMILDYLQESHYRSRSPNVDTEVSPHLADVLE
jgi:glucoamylase